MRIYNFIFLVVLGFSSFGLFAPTLANAQLKTGVVETDEFAPLINSAKENGLKVIIIEPGEEEVLKETQKESFQEKFNRLKTEFGVMVKNIPNLFSDILRTLKRASPDGTYWWLLKAVAIAIGAILAGRLVIFSMRRVSEPFIAPLFKAKPEREAEKISTSLQIALIILINILISYGVQILVVQLFYGGHGPTWATAIVIITTHILYRIFRHVIFFSIISPDTPDLRVINLSDEDAHKMQVHWRNAVLAVACICSVFMWLVLIGMPQYSLKFLVIVSLFICGIILSSVIYNDRKAINGIFAGSDSILHRSFLRRFLGAFGAYLMIFYMAFAWFVSSIRILLNQPDSLSIIGAPVVATIVGVLAYSIIIILIDKIYKTRQMRFEKLAKRDHDQYLARMEAEQKELEEALANSPEDDEDIIVSQIMSTKEFEEMPAFKPVMKSLLENAVGILISIVAFGFILSQWDVNLGEKGNPVTAFIDTLMVIFIAWFLYRMVVAYVDHQLEEEGIDPNADDDTLGEEGMGQSTSRLATLLPLLRNVLVVSIVILAIMIVLANAGINIAPLFAGAGVIGLAVGFGAQTLIRDIFSGGFFLFDDAFRKGEYIELGTIRGTVEKISLRSFQLRHHTGPLHTIPFGEITQLTNYSRDWVMMKLPLRLTYDTDIERVRKLVKKLGQKLLEHPEVGKLFLQPLKSQGVYKMEDSAMIIRVKFMTRPGDQFVTRKVVYASIRELFEQENIRFATKEVTVRLADEVALTDDQKKALTAASEAVIEADEAEKNAGSKKGENDQ